MRLWQKTNEREQNHLATALESDEDLQQRAREHCATGVRLLERGLEDQALAEFQKALSKDKCSAEAHYNLALVYERRNHSAKAIKHYERAIRFDPRFFEAFNYLGIAYKNSDRPIDAIRSFIRAIRIKPDYVEAHVNLAMLYFSGGRYPEAIKACHKALEIKPTHPSAHYTLGLIYIDLRYEDTALEEYDILKELDPDMADELLRAIDKEFRA